MKKSTLSLLLGLGLAVSAACFGNVPANADTYHFTFNSLSPGELNIVGNFDVANGAVGSTALLDISGIVSGTDASGVISGLQGSNNPDGEYHAPSGNAWTLSNTYDTATMLFDGNGVLFDFGAGNIGNIYTLPPTYASLDDPQGDFLPGVAGTLSVAQTPLPAALPMFLGGIGVLGLVTRRRKARKASSAPALQA